MVDLVKELEEDLEVEYCLDFKDLCFHIYTKNAATIYS